MSEGRYRELVRSCADQIHSDHLECTTVVRASTDRDSLSLYIYMGARSYRIGPCIFDVQSGELRRGTAAPIQLRPQLATALSLLASRAGELVTRDQFKHVLWGERTVDFDAGLNFCIKHLRAALGDAATIETLPRRGYRLIGQVEARDDSMSAMPSSSDRAIAAPKVDDRIRDAGRASGVLNESHRSRRWIVVAICVLAISVWALATMVGRRQPSDTIRLAVLPVQGLNDDVSADDLAAGLTDDLITQLGRLAPEHMYVLAPDSISFAAHNHDSLRELGRALDARYLLISTLRSRSTDEVGEALSTQVLLNVRLVLASDQSVLWTESYDEPLGSVANLQADIAKQVAGALALRLVPASHLALTRATTSSTTAYQAYLRGHEAMQAGTETGFRNAVAAFKRATAEDQGFAMAHAALAGAQTMLYDYGFIPAAEVCEHAAPAAARALALDASLPRSHLWQAVVQELCGGDPATVRSEFRRALELNPSDAMAYRRYGWYLLTHGDMREALRQMRLGLMLDPLSPDAHAAVAYAEHSLGRSDEALEESLQALRIDPEFPFGLYVSARAYAQQKRFDEAIRALEAAVHSSKRGPKYVFSLGMLYVQVGRPKEARRMLEELDSAARSRYVPAAYTRSLADALQEL
jgi:tetratricopeptide (TPR) repeat protein/DNA-binding winged helix-turn-helix (wHTH) protein